MPNLTSENNFNIMNMRSHVHGKFFLEASAGTGKTFTIEHLILRHVLFESVSNLENVLAVTFTKAATEELRCRIKNTLISARDDLKKIIDSQKIPSEGKPYYLPESTSLEDVKRLYIKIRIALTTVENASVYTIHSFCRKLLDTYNPGIQIPSPPPGLTLNQGFQSLIAKYLAQDLWREVLFFEQFDFISQAHNYSFSQRSFISLLNDQLQQGMLHPPKNFLDNLCSRLQKTAEKLSPLQTFSKTDIIDSIYKALPSREGVDIDQFVEDIFKIQDLVSFSIEKSPPPIFLHYRLSNQILKTKDKTTPLSPLNIIKQSNLCDVIQDFFDQDTLLSLLCTHINQYIQKTFGPCLSYSHLISSLEKILCENSDRAAAIRAEIRDQYQLVLIDESQDTDKLQWNIFHSLFLTPEYSGSLFIIGDPKQSIYQWRNADLHSYLEVKNSFPSDQILQMNCNYRSTPKLMTSINHFFSLKNTLLSIPVNDTNVDIHYYHCDAGETSSSPIHNSRSPIHFFPVIDFNDAIEQINAEAVRLHTEHHISYGDMAVIVSQNKQALAFIQKSPLPTSLIKSKSLLSETSSYSLLLIFLEVLNDPCNANKVASILSSCLFGYSMTKIQKEIEQEIEFFVTLSEYLNTKKLLSTFYKLMDRCGDTLIASSSEGCIIYQELEQLSLQLETLTPYPNQYLIYLKDLKEMDAKEDSLQISLSDNDKETMKITTVHSSKGLEYEVVFLLALLTSTNSKNNEEVIHETYVSVTRAKQQVYIPSKAPSYLSKYFDLANNDPKIKTQKKILDTFIDKLTSENPESFSFGKLEPVNRDIVSELTDSLIPPKSFSLPMITTPEILSFSKVYESRSVSTPSPLKDCNEIPSGRAFGILVHEILEKIDLSLLSGCFLEHKVLIAIEPFITNYTKNTSFEKHSSFIAQLIAKAFTTPITFSTQTFCLSEIDHKKVFKEAVFLTEDNNNLWKGSIDIFFEHHGSYYIIDWKTSVLESYSQKSLSEYIVKHNFNKQADIYVNAAKKFLKQFEITTTPEMAFVFLRGLETHEGIFIH